MLETSHHSITQYKLSSTGELVPLLQIAPSKTAEERALLVISELADVLSAIVWRVRDRNGALSRRTHPRAQPRTDVRAQVLARLIKGT